MAEPAIKHPQCCLNIGDGAIRMWGTVEAVQMTGGVKPDAAVMICPEHEFGKLQDDYDRSGVLELYWSNPDTPDVQLKAWSIDHVEETLHGATPDDATHRALELAITLTDRRWEMTGGRGGRVFWGVLNRSKEDGKAVTQDVDIDGITQTSGWTWGLLIQTLGKHLKCASGGFRLDADYSPPTSLYGLEKPRDVDLHGKLIPDAIAEACRRCEAVFTVSTTGDYFVYAMGSDTLKGEPAGVGRVGALPAADKLPTSQYVTRSMRSGRVVVTSAPQPVVVQEEMPLSDAEGAYWQLAGIDRDGSIKPLVDLSYVTASGKTPTEIVRGAFADLSDPADRVLAKQTFGRLLWMTADAAKTRLPLLRRLAETVDDSGSRTRGPSLRVRAKHMTADDQGVYSNPGDYLDVPIDQVDHVHGVIVVSERLGKLAGGGEAYGEFDDFSFLSADEVKVTVAHESQGAAYADYFCRAYGLDGGGAVQEVDLAETMDPDYGDVRIVSVPELVAYEVDDAVVNEAELEACAEAVAGRLLQQPTATETLRYRGLHNVSVSGTVASVRWDLVNGVTEIEHVAYHVAASRYLRREALRRTAADASAGGAGGRSAPQLSSQGASRWALPPRSLLIGGAPLDTRPRPVRAKITASQLISGETDKWEYTAARCKKIAAGHGGDAVWQPVAGEAALTAYNDLEWPDGAADAVKNGTPVWLWPHVFESGGSKVTEWWFAVGGTGIGVGDDGDYYQTVNVGGVDTAMWDEPALR